MKCTGIAEMALVNVNCRGRSEVETRGEDDVTRNLGSEGWQQVQAEYKPEDQNASTMIIALGFDIGVGH